MSLYEDDDDVALKPEAPTVAGWSKGLNMAQSTSHGRPANFVARKIAPKPAQSSTSAPTAPSLPPVINLGGGGKQAKMDTAPRIFSFGADKVFTV